MNKHKLKIVTADELSSQAQQINFCYNCSIKPLLNWKGWPVKDAVPFLPAIADGKCPNCGEVKVLYSTQIMWMNVHGPFNTGLPDHWIFMIVDGSHGESTNQLHHWGAPYYRINKCTSCSSQTIDSLFLPSNSSYQIIHECPKCSSRKTEIFRLEPYSSKDKEYGDFYD